MTSLSSLLGSRTNAEQAVQLTGEIERMAREIEGLKIDRERLSPFVRICVEILESVFATHDLVEAAGELVSASARFDRWFYEHKHGKRATRIDNIELTKLLEGFEQLSERLEKSFSEFMHDPERNEPSLVAEVRSIRDKLLATSGMAP